MGLREKVALMLTFTTLMQIFYVSCTPRDNPPSKTEDSRKQIRNIDAVTQPPILITIRPKQGSKVRTKQAPVNNQEPTLRKTFNFPDVEYPTASTPRPPFYLQETNILQRNPVQRNIEFPTATTVQYPINGNKNDVLGRYNAKQQRRKTTKKPAETITYPEFGSTPKPYWLREEGAFPDVDYPLSAKDTWKPNYWKQIPNNRPKNEINPYEAEFVSRVNSASSSSSLKNGKNIVTKSGAIKKDYKNVQKTPAKTVETLPSDNSNRKPDNYQQVALKEEPGKVNLNKIDSQIPTSSTSKPKSSKEVKSCNQQTTPAPSVNTKSTTSFVLTPYTTVYFDTTPSNLDTITSKDDNQSPSAASKKKGRKKKKKIKTTKKENSSKISEITIVTDDETLYTVSPLTTPMHISEEVTEITISPKYQNTQTGSSNMETCPFVNNDTLSYTHTTTATPYLNSDINPQLTLHCDDKVFDDKEVASINTIVPNRDNKDSSCFEDSVIRNNKLSMREDITINSTACERQDGNQPSEEEEFTTDVFPDFDENLSAGSTSTVSPLSFNPDGEIWAIAEIIDPDKSLSYPDELEQYYIIVP